METLLPDEALAASAAEAIDVLPSAENTPPASRVTVELPAGLLGTVLDLLHQVALGNAVTIVPIHAELTTHQAAKLLNVSRPHVVKLLDAGKIPFHRAGTHRRVRAQDLFEYKEQRDKAARTRMAELVAEAQDMGDY